MKIIGFLCLTIAVTFSAGFTYRKGVTEYLRPKVQAAARERINEDRDRHLREVRVRDFDLAEELEISAEDAERIHAFEVDGHDAMFGKNQPTPAEDVLRKMLREEEARFSEKFGAAIAYRYQNYKKQYTARAEVKVLRDRMAPLGQTLSYTEARKLLEAVRNEYTTSVEYLKYAPSAEQFRKRVEVQVDYNRKLIAAAPEFLNAKQCNVLTLVLRRRLHDEYREAVEHLQKTKPGFVLTNAPVLE